jgi:hypothetical protein
LLDAKTMLRFGCSTLDTDNALDIGLQVAPFNLILRCGDLVPLDPFREGFRQSVADAPFDIPSTIGSEVSTEW